MERRYPSTIIIIIVLFSANFSFTYSQFSPQFFKFITEENNESIKTALKSDKYVLKFITSEQYEWISTKKLLANIFDKFESLDEGQQINKFKEFAEKYDPRSADIYSLGKMLEKKKETMLDEEKKKALEKLIQDMKEKIPWDRPKIDKVIERLENLVSSESHD